MNGMAQKRYRCQRKLEDAEKMEADGLGDLFGFNEIHDLANVRLNLRRRIIIEEEEKIQKEATHLRRNFLIPDLRQTAL